jgi:hypothetical protein
MKNGVATTRHLKKESENYFRISNVVCKTTCDSGNGLTNKFRFPSSNTSKVLNNG